MGPHIWNIQIVYFISNVKNNIIYKNDSLKYKYKNLYEIQVLY